MWKAGRTRFPSQLAALEYLRASARAHATSPAIRQVALSILRGQPFNGTSERARALLHWVNETITFIPDPYRAELFQSPMATLELGAGDCDDAATLLASLTTSVGIPTRLVASGYQGQLSHVFPEVLISGRWLAADSTIPGTDLGILPPHDTFRPTERV